MKKIFLLCLIIFNNTYALDFSVTDQGKQPIIAGTHSIGDLNGDGYNDMFSSGLIAINYFYGLCSLGCFDTVGYIIDPQVLINNKRGGFEPLKQNNGFDLFPELAVGDIVNGLGYSQFSPYFSTISDVDNDGDNDIITSNGRVYLNDGVGNFSFHINVGYPNNNGEPIYAADFDNDGVVEILTLGRIYRRISLQPLKYAEMPTGMNLNSKANIEIADFDNDGFLDVLSYTENKDIIILYNNQQGGFPNSKIVSLSKTESLTLVVGDIDNDGYSDIILSNGDLLKNSHNQLFETVENVLILNSQFVNLGPSIEYSIFPRKLIKYNNDDFLDLHVTISNNNTSFSDIVFINNQEGQFHNNLYIDQLLINSPTQLYRDTSSFSGDFNRDEKEDFITLNVPPFVGSNSRTVSQSNLSKYKNLVVSPHELNLLLTDDFARSHPAYFNMVPYAEVKLANFDNDERKEILFSNYQNSNDSLSDLHYMPFYLSNFSHERSVYQSIEMPSCFDNFGIINSIPIDLNNDKLDDLIININNYFTYCNNKELVLINTGDGFILDEDIIVPDLSSVRFYNRISALDFNGDGFDDIYSWRYKLLYINDNGNSFSEGIKMPVFNTTSEIVDINSDGKADIAYIDENSYPHVIYGSEDINQIVDVKISNVTASAISFFDFDFDGLMDLYIWKKGSKYVIQLKNNNDNFTETNELLFKDYIPQANFKVIDLNHDRKLEIISDVVYQLNFNDVYEVLSHESIPEIYVLGDFDGDSLIDIIFRNKILYSRNFSFYTGLSYDPNHSGHGFSIEHVGGEQFFTVFYTYDNEGNPEWYTDLGMFEKPREDYWNIASTGSGLIRNEYDYANQTVIQNMDTQYKGSVQHYKCSDNYGKIDLSFEIGIDGFGRPINSGDWCSMPIVDYYQRPLEDDLSGLWWAGADDSGWGWSISLVERDNTTDMVLVLYYYDAQGNPRWLIGQQSGFVKGQEITLDMNMVKGYGRGYTPTDLTFTPAGTITLTLNQVSNDLSKAGVMSIDVTYPGSEGGNWVRNNIPIALFSKPRN